MKQQPINLNMWSHTQDAYNSTLISVAVYCPNFKGSTDTRMG